MIRVERQAEPTDFDERVRQPGRQAVTALATEYGSVDAIPSDRLPTLWRGRALEQLHGAYGGICAYVCVYIEPVTGAKTTDHFVARSREPGLAYEWGNYRLACALMNARKGVVLDVLDPFEIKDGWFELSLPGFRIFPRRTLRGALRDRVQATIDKLGLSGWECVELRRRQCLDYQTGRVDIRWLERESPFLARELRRLKLLIPGD